MPRLLGASFFFNYHVQVFLQPPQRGFSTAVIWANSWSECIVQTWQRLLLVFIQPTKAAAVCERCQQMFVLREMPTFEAYMPEHAATQHLLLFTCLRNRNNHGGTWWNALHDHLCSASPSSQPSAFAFMFRNQIFFYKKKEWRRTRDGG